MANLGMSISVVYCIANYIQLTYNSYELFKVFSKLTISLYIFKYLQKKIIYDLIPYRKLEVKLILDTPFSIMIWWQIHDHGGMYLKEMQLQPNA